MQYLEKFKFISYFGNSVYDYLIALLIFIGLLIILKIIQVIIIGRLKKIAKKTKTDLDDTLISIFGKVKPPFYLLISFYFGIKFLDLPQEVSEAVKVIFLVAVVYEVITGLGRTSDYFVGKYLSGMEKNGSDQNQAMIKAVNMLVKGALWLVGLTLILANLGVNVTSIIASLGIGGIAVALALQNILKDMFSSFSIYVDKPFSVGDYIVVGAHSGDVERIGLKTTRIRTLQGQELVISNNELTSARVENFRKMEKRRVSFDLGVTYKTKKDKLEKIPQIIKDIIELNKGVDFDRCHFKSYGDFALNFEVVYHINTPDYDEYMDTNQKINLAIFDQFSKEKIDFAYPTQTVFVKK